MNQETLEKMRQLRLFGMYDAFKTSLESSVKETLTQDQLIALLINSEWDDRKNRNIERALKSANFRYKASMEQVDFEIERGLDKNQFHRLANLNFVKERKDLFIIGSTGTGKSYLATALGYQACQMGYRVLYTATSKLMGHLKLAKAKGTILAELKKIERQDLLILDDFGLQPLDSQARALMLDIIEDRHQKRSILITSQIPVKQWYEIIGEKTIADAILDRIVHHALRIELFGESLRRKNSDKEKYILSPQN